MVGPSPAWRGSGRRRRVGPSPVRRTRPAWIDMVSRAEWRCRRRRWTDRLARLAGLHRGAHLRGRRARIPAADAGRAADGLVTSEEAPMAADATGSWQAIVASSLGWHEAHAPFEAAVADLPTELRGRRPERFPHSPWELVDHIRRTQADLVAFMENPAYTAPSWPADYWPSEPAPPTAGAWDESLSAVRRDRERLQAFATHATVDLTARI